MDNELKDQLLGIYERLPKTTIEEQGDNWVPLTSFGNAAIKDGIDYKALGYSKLRNLMNDSALFIEYAEQSGKNPVYYYQKKQQVSELVVASTAETPQGYVPEVEPKEGKQPIVGIIEKDASGFYHCGDVVLHSICSRFNGCKCEIRHKFPNKNKSSRDFYPYFCIAPSVVEVDFTDEIEVDENGICHCGQYKLSPNWMKSKGADAHVSQIKPSTKHNEDDIYFGIVSQLNIIGQPVWKKEKMARKFLLERSLASKDEVKKEHNIKFDYFIGQFVSDGENDRFKIVDIRDGDLTRLEERDPIFKGLSFELPLYKRKIKSCEYYLFNWKIVSKEPLTLDIDADSDISYIPTEIVNAQEAPTPQYVSNKTCILIDTNVFIDCPDIIQKISNEYTIMVVNTVVDELNGLKERPELSLSAREALKNIYNYSDYVKLVKAVRPYSPFDADCSNDQRILSVAFLKQYQDQNVVLLSSDVGMRLTAKYYAINSVSLDEYKKKGEIPVMKKPEKNNIFQLVKFFGTRAFRTMFGIMFKERSSKRYTIQFTGI